MGDEGAVGLGHQTEVVILDEVRVEGGGGHVGQSVGVTVGRVDHVEGVLVDPDGRLDGSAVEARSVDGAVNLDETVAEGGDALELLDRPVRKFKRKVKRCRKEMY